MATPRYERVTLRTARSAVQRKILFKGSNIYSRWVYEHPDYTPATLPNQTFTPMAAAIPVRYVVYSYGSHFPMYVWDTATQRWYGNKDKYSRSTSRHQSACQPLDIRYEPFHWLDTDTLARVATWGVVEALEMRIQHQTGNWSQAKAAYLAADDYE